MSPDEGLVSRLQSDEEARIDRLITRSREFIHPADAESFDERLCREIRPLLKQGAEDEDFLDAFRRFESSRPNPDRRFPGWVRSLVGEAVVQARKSAAAFEGLPPRPALPTPTPDRYFDPKAATFD